MPDEAEIWRPEFKPGWPDLFPLGLIIGRTVVTQRAVPPEVEEPSDESEVVWIVHAGIAAEAPRLAFLGDLTVRNDFAFAGVTVVMPISMRDEPDELDQEYVDDLLRQYGEWVAPLMYDHAATVMRSALAGNGLPLEVPFGTPDAQIHTSDVDRPDTGDDG